MNIRNCLIAALATTGLVLGATACGDDDEVAPTPTLTGVEGVSPPPASPSPTPPPKPTPSEARELKAGQIITVTTEDGPAEITLLAVHNATAIGDAKADAGQQYVVYTMQVKNLSSTGTTEWNTSWLESPRWSGTNREAVSPVFVIGPEDPKLIPYDPFSSTPEPRPGEHVKATEVLGVPNNSGTLQFEDDAGNAHFNIVIR
ncbi:hypothetical protein [Streptomyces sp. TRM68367]|uniref:hypothetical protein n=1 Tax=Streptomyces sp. TRM68367 TaxID=2758415 RepID=UPI00165B4506|nr:hypothetical protein [Streptomyces sp. TRM68367]MBC9728820.1 hypothetical protein [Streptomyces sp. TRM68367]